MLRALLAGGVCERDLPEELATSGCLQVIACRELKHCPEGPERHLDAARQKLPRDNFCRSVAPQIIGGGQTCNN